VQSRSTPITARRLSATETNKSSVGDADGNDNSPKASSEQKRKWAGEWEFQPDHTSIPRIEERIMEFYRQHRMRVYQSTMQKLIALINHVASTGGEARLGIASLRKMGFPDHASRKHISRLERAGIIDIIHDYCPAAARSNRYKLTRSAMEVIMKGRIAKTA